jgi:hypothetical protein
MLEVDILAPAKFNIDDRHQFALDADCDVARTNDARGVAYLRNGLICGTHARRTL